MSITDAYGKMLEVVNSKFPNWTGFDDPRFIEEETGYKNEASKKAKEILDKNVLQKLISENKFNDILKRIEKVGQSTNLLYLSTPKTGDLGIIYQDNLNKKDFCEIFYNLLHGEEELKVRFKNYLHYVRENELPNKFTFPTYFLFLLYPETEIIIKPTIINQFGNFINPKHFNISKPYFPSYDMVKNIAFELKEKLQDYGAKDMIDVQSFIWVAVKSGVDAQNNMEKLETYLKEFVKVSDKYLKNDDYVRRHYDFFQNFVKKENLEKAKWEDFQEMGNYIHSFNMAIARANALGKPNHPIEHYRNSFKYLVYGEEPINERIKNFCENDNYSLKYFGNSAIGEIIGNVLADDYIFMNRRDEFAIEFLGIKPEKDKGDKFVERFIKFNEATKPIIDKYKEIVGRKTDLPINLEVDQFFNYLYETYSKLEPKPFPEPIQTNNDEKQYWLIAAGQKAKLWQDFIDNEICAIGWTKLSDLVGDLSKYNSLEDIKAKMIEAYGEGNSYMNDGLACFEFVWKMKIGDYIFIKTGRDKILGLGQIKSDYFYDESRSEYLNCRKVKWLKTGEWKFKKKFALKTLTNITKYTDFVEELKKLIETETPPPKPPIEIYTKEQALFELFIVEKEFDTILQTLKYKKNIILQGAPGVGKTFIAKRIAYLMMGEEDNSRVEMIQFHQSYSYEDFIQGYRPTDNGGFEIKNGVFYEFCKKAQRNSDKDYFFIIDEINRGNLSKIFGELMMLIEKDKRGKEFAIPLTYSKNEDEKFYLPENLYFIGTMNTADRSLAMVDYALRRRFGFITLEPAFGKEKFVSFLKEKKVPEALIKIINEKMLELNKLIQNDDKNLGEGYRIGHSYFCPDGDNESDIDWYRGIVINEIAPLLCEYWFENKDKVDSEIKKLLEI